MITFNLTTILVLAAIAVVVLYFTWPAFRQMLQIKGGKAVAGATKASEKQRHEHQRLTAELNRQLDNVASAKASATQAEKDVAAAEAQVEKLTGQYKIAVTGNASEDAKNAIAGNIAKAKASVTSKRAAANEAAKIAAQAVEALDQTREALKDFADQIQDTEQKEALTAVLNTAADASLALKNIKDRLSAAGEAARQADTDLEKARAKNELAQGSDTDREIAKIEKDAAAAAERARLDAELGITSTPPAQK
ncbi:MAG TPA: hypothetical protein PL112_19090 [Candidatus Obscuribacter sp.]|nr:hypothetical protein [Candidatus Obscuribacter sp.]